MTDNIDITNAEVQEPDTGVEDVEQPDTAEGDVSDATPDSETFPRQVVEDLRKENGKYRQRAQQSDALAQRLHTELVRATGRLADPTDLPFDESHLEDSDSLSLAIDELLESKPHLATRRPTGDIGQGQRGPASANFSLLQTLKDLT